MHVASQLVLFLLVGSVSAKPMSPIVIVPGVLGNQFEGKLNKTTAPHVYCTKHSDWENLWLSVTKLLPYVVDCLADTLTLHHTNVSGVSSYCNTEGVQTRVPGFGKTFSVEYLDPSFQSLPYAKYFYSMVDQLVTKFGYQRNKTIVAAPYDWRVSPVQWKESGYYDNLKKLIETTYLNGGKQKVTLIAHSMGAPNTLYFLTKFVTQDWKDQYLERLITLSGAWRGAVKSAEAFISGTNEDIFFDRPIWGRSAQRSYPSTAFLLPCPSKDTWPMSRVIVETPNRSYTAWDYKDLFHDMGYDEGYRMFTEVESLSCPMPPPNITVHCFYGNTGNKTPSFLQYDDKFPDVQPSITKEEGDGTVNINSLQSCGLWKGRQPQSVEVRGFDGVEHVDMVRTQSVIDAVIDILSGGGS